MIVTLFMLQLLLLLGTMTVLSSSSDVLHHPHCQRTCDNVSIPYPFGIGAGCFRDRDFEVTCKENGTDGSQMLLFANDGKIHRATHISLSDGQVRMSKHIGHICYNDSGIMSHDRGFLDFRNTVFTVSSANNTFIGIGCNTFAVIEGVNNHYYKTGCLSYCESRDSVTDGTCNGVGCCETSIGKDLFNYKMDFLSSLFKNNKTVNLSGKCSYGFVIEKGKFSFKSEFLDESFLQLHEVKDGVPLLLDWVVGKQKCELAKKNTSYACLSPHSDCLDSTVRSGYLCKCSKGYHGNPYLPNGCKDIDECKLENACSGNICTNTDGNYTCKCNIGMYTDDPKSKLCDPHPKSGLSLRMKITLGICAGFVLLLFIFLNLMYVEFQKKKLSKEKKRFFEKNGGLILTEELKTKSPNSTFNVYRKEELERATNMFDTERILGRGGHATVFLGIFDEETRVAIKKSKVIDAKQKKEFAKEIYILSKVGHPNVVKILGCCLEVEVPMLVYEFVANGTLYNYIHKNRSQPISLHTRLTIASHSAEALVYLHSASPPILHGDIKPSNILLDEEYDAKVSDFGASTLVVADELQLATMVQGTLGYLDPEYIQTYILTEKSDVYSFGVVLLELLTRKKAFFKEGNEGKSLASIFLSLMKEGRFEECFDNDLIHEGNKEILGELAELVKECLSTKGEERPTMKEVAEELQTLRRVTQHPWGRQHVEEVASLLGRGESMRYNTAEFSGSYSLEINTETNIKSGR